MKRTLSLVLVAGVAFSLGHFLQGPVPLAGAAGGGLPPSGDVNGDGKLNIADGIYIINHQFLGGPAPVPIECPPTGVPATGQTKCYGLGGEIDCGSSDYPGQDGLYQAGCPGEGRFVDNGDGTVTDTCTGLMWQQDTADVNGDGEITPTDPAHGGPDALSWQDALKYCESLSFAGRDDWRLPNVRELQTIVNYGRLDLAIDPVFGAVSGVPSHYWTSSPYVYDPEYAWFLHFSDGTVNNYQKPHPIHVRAVRNAP